MWNTSLHPCWLLTQRQRPQRLDRRSFDKIYRHAASTAMLSCRLLSAVYSSTFVFGHGSGCGASVSTFNFESSTSSSFEFRVPSSPLSREAHFRFVLGGIGRLGVMLGSLGCSVIHSSHSVKDPLVLSCTRKKCSHCSQTLEVHPRPVVQTGGNVEFCAAAGASWWRTGCGTQLNLCF